MLTGRTRLIIAAGILIPAVIYLGLDEQKKSRFRPDAPSASQQQSDYYIVNGKIRDYSARGALEQQLSARQLEHLPALQQTTVIEPQLTIFDASSPPQSVSSKAGIILDDNSQVTLAGNVVLQNNPDQSRATILTTEALLFFPQKDLIQTDRPVVLTSPIGKTTATGMTIDTRHSKIDLLSKVKGIYHVQ